MPGENREDWLELCERAANEQDPEKLLKLVEEITRILEEKEQAPRRIREAEPKAS